MLCFALKAQSSTKAKHKMIKLKIIKEWAEIIGWALLINLAAFGIFFFAFYLQKVLCLLSN
jgi:hypothetical protein